MSKTISKKSLRTLVDMTETIPGWLRTIGMSMGRCAEDYCQQYSDVMNEIYHDEYKKWKKSQVDRATEMFEFIKSNPLNRKIPKNKITPEMIKQANQFPIEKLLEVDSRKMAICLNHKDTKPSMFCKNNFAHCFSCGWTADPIKIYMHKNGVTFKEAVLSLCQKI